MFTTLGVGSCCSNILAVQTAIHDKFPKFKTESVSRWICLAGFFSGLLYVTPGGPKLNDLVTEFSYSIPVILFGLGEVIVVAFIYGVDNFLRDINFMLGRRDGRRLGLYWKVCWVFFCPAGLIVLLVASITENSYFRNPSALLPFGCIILFSALLLVPIVLAYNLYKGKGSLSSRWSEAFSPATTWGPACVAKRKEWQEHVSQEKSRQGRTVSKVKGQMEDAV